LEVIPEGIQPLDEGQWTMILGVLPRPPHRHKRDGIQIKGAPVSAPAQSA
jgi:hypothetical protein